MRFFRILFGVLIFFAVLIGCLWALNPYNLRAWLIYGVKTSSEVYSWTDEKGVKTFSDSPPSKNVKDLKKTQMYTTSDSLFQKISKTISSLNTLFLSNGGKENLKEAEEKKWRQAEERAKKVKTQLIEPQKKASKRKIEEAKKGVEKAEWKVHKAKRRLKEAKIKKGRIMKETFTWEKRKHHDDRKRKAEYRIEDAQYTLKGAEENLKDAENQLRNAERGIN